MGIKNKPETFTGQAAPQLPWLDSDFDALFSEFNGNIDDANIKGAANIQQSKISNLITDLAAKILKIGDTMTGALGLKFSIPYVRLIGTETAAKDWSLAESGGALLYRENTNTEAVPAWTTRYTLASGAAGPAAATDLTHKSYVDAKVATVGPLQFGQAVKSDGNFTTTSTTFVDVPGLSVTITTGARRCRVTFTARGASGSTATRILSVNLQVDGVDQSGTDGMLSITSTDSTLPENVSFSFITNVLTAGAHVFKIQTKCNAGNSMLYASTTSHAILAVEELPLTA